MINKCHISHIITPNSPHYIDFEDSAAKYPENAPQGWQARRLPRIDK